MTLGEARRRWSYLFCEKLLPKVKELTGYDYAVDETTNHSGTGHRPGSLHYDGCAGDLLLYDKDGVYLKKTEVFKPLGDYWKTLDPDCRWGGDFKDDQGHPAPDGDHFSFAPKEIFGGRA